MKTNLSRITCISIFLILASCNNPGSKETTVTEDSSNKPAVDNSASVAETENDIVARAKAYEDTVFSYMSKAISAMNDDAKTPVEKKTTKDEMNNLAKAYQTKIDSLKALLPANKAKEIDDYRQQLFDQQTNKKKE